MMADNDHTPFGFVCIVRHITGNKKMQEELQRVQKLESLGISAGSIAHDFNNLLNGIFGYIELAKKQTNPGEKKQVTAIEKLITDTANFSLSGSNIVCNYSFMENLWLVEIDPMQIAQMLSNIIINARQAMNDSGFFFTTKQNGVGLGLAISHSIIKNHDGHIKVTSTPGKGTTFVIDLPVSDKQLAPVETKKPATQIKGGSNILLMDDELFLLELLKEALEGMNYRVDLSKNGEEAIEKYVAAMQSGQLFDAVILDLTVHGGMGGKMTIEKLLEINPQVKGIASSGYSEDPIFANPKEYGFSGTIKKPYSIENLCEVLERVLNE